MAKTKGAGTLDKLVTFSEPVAGSDGAGGVKAGFTPRFDAAAAYTHLRGGETIMAARLTGKHVVVMRVRTSAQSRAVGYGWTATDKRAGTVYNIRDVSPVDLDYLDITCESGVAV